MKGFSPLFAIFVCILVGASAGILDGWASKSGRQSGQSMEQGVRGEYKSQYGRLGEDMGAPYRSRAPSSEESLDQEFQTIQRHAQQSSQQQQHQQQQHNQQKSIWGFGSDKSDEQQYKNQNKNNNKSSQNKNKKSSDESNHGSWWTSSHKWGASSSSEEDKKYNNKHSQESRENKGRHTNWFYRFFGLESSKESSSSESQEQQHRGQYKNQNQNKQNQYSKSKQNQKQQSAYQGSPIVHKQKVLRNPNNQKEICITVQAIPVCARGTTEQKTEQRTIPCLCKSEQELQKQGLNLKSLQKKVNQGEQISWGNMQSQKQVRVQLAQQCVQKQSRSSSSSSEESKRGSKKY